MLKRYRLVDSQFNVGQEVWLNPNGYACRPYTFDYSEKLGKIVEIHDEIATVDVSKGNIYK